MGTLGQEENLCISAHIEEHKAFVQQSYLPAVERILLEITYFELQILS